MQRIIFVTGTDTGVGKSVLTALLTAHLPGSIALKPFSSGDRSDAQLMAAVAGIPSDESSLDKINPWHFTEPLSPWTAARRAGRSVSLDDVLAFIRSFCDKTILIEGAGGVLTPLGEGFSGLDLIRVLHADVILVAPNKLGVLNQVRLALAALNSCRVNVALMEQLVSDLSKATNYADLTTLISPVSVIQIPWIERFNQGVECIYHATQGLSRELSALLTQKKSPGHGAEGTLSL